MNPVPGSLSFQIESIKQETPEAKTYTLKPEDDTFSKFLPGQFLTFILNIDGKELRRSYSMVSLPGEPLKFTVKRVENGLVSRFILTHWKIGDQITALAPAGRFVLPPQNKYPRDIFFMAAGSGIAPILPQIRKLLVAEPQSIIHLYYSNRDESDRLFGSELSALQKGNKQLRIRHFLSNPRQHPEKRQRLNNGILEELVKTDLRFDHHDAVFMLCGPFAYMRMVRITLRFMHFGESQIHKENFLPELQRSGMVPVRNFDQKNITVIFKGKEHPIAVEKNQTILRAALKNNIPLPYSCEGGICSTCMIKCLQGKVEMTINEVLTDHDLAEGWVLTCTGHPVDDAVVLMV